MPALRASAPTCAAGCTRPPLVGTWVSAISLTRSSSSLAQCLQVHLPGLVAFHHADLGAGTLRHLQKCDVVAGVFVGRGHDTIARRETQRVKGHFPGPGCVFLQRDLLRSAMQQARHAAVQAIKFRGDQVGRLVAAYLLFQPKMLNHPRDHGSRL